MPFGCMAARPKPPGPLARRAALSARRRRYRVAVNQSPVAQQRDRKDEDGSSGPRQCAVTAPPDRRARQDPRPGRQQPNLVRLPVAAPFWPRPGTCSRRRGASSRMRWRPPFPAQLDPRARRRLDPKIRRKHALVEPDARGDPMKRCLQKREVVRFWQIGILAWWKAYAASLRQSLRRLSWWGMKFRCSRVRVSSTSLWPWLISRYDAEMGWG